MNAKIRILYIDDYDLDRELVRDSLEKEHGGFVLMEASNKQEFESLLKNHAFDLVLSDFNIAGFEGLQVLEAVKEHAPEIPVIIVTGTGSEEIAVKALKQGASDYVIKRPQHIRKLPQTILAVIEKQSLMLKKTLAEKALSQSESHLRILVNTIPDLIWLKDPDGFYLSCNPMFERFFGAKESEIIGKTDFDFVDKDLADFFRENDRKAMAADSLKRNEEELTFADNGYSGIFETIKTPMRDSDGKLIGVLGIARDITAQKQAEKELKEALLQQIEAVKAANVGLWDWDLTTNKVHYSNEWKRQIGYDDSEIEDDYKEWESRVHPDDLLMALKKVQNNINKKAKNHQTEFRFLHKNGTYLWILAQGSVITDKSGQAIRMIGSHIDITERKLADREKENLRAQLTQAQKMESIGSLAGGIAHDFNNILSSIIGFTELALDDVAKGTPLEDNLQEVYTAGKRARDLVKQILAFARQSAEIRKPIQVDTIAKEVLKLIRSTIPTTIEIKENIRSRSLIMGNTSQVHQLFMNLCTNAAQAMDDAGGILEIGLTDVEINGQTALQLSELKFGNYMKVTVSDTGPGISPDIMGSIFDPYFTTKGAGEGTGLGLALVHGIVESYGGKITVDSELGKGTVFSIYLPITESREDLRPYEKENLPSGNERILFVDDELPIAKMGSQILARLGYRVTVRTSSVEALELFRSKSDDFDLVITDMTMPNMTGDELAMELIALKYDIPVILCTGFSKKITDEKATEIGIKAFAYKPVAKADLANTVRKVLDEAKTKSCA